MNEKEAREIYEKVMSKHGILSGYCSVDEWIEIKGFLDGLAQGREEAKGLVEAMENFKKQFQSFSERQHEILVRSQTLESASKNWEDFPEAFHLNLEPIFDALSAYRESEGKEGEK